ncbi:MAG: type II toxin-antitoxin system HicB family antitoxin [Acidobacteria bacterium]|nr:type II toxin-antitoxin system HicB family antitoxin [Acidobacteriota bacterium]
MTRRVSVVVEHDDEGYYAYCPDLRGCQTQGATLQEAMDNIREAIELYLETLPADQRIELLSREILMTSVEVEVA